MPSNVLGYHSNKDASDIESFSNQFDWHIWRGKFAIKLSLKTPPPLNRVATLPCKMFIIKYRR